MLRRIIHLIATMALLLGFLGFAAAPATAADDPPPTTGSGAGGGGGPAPPSSPYRGGATAVAPPPPSSAAFYTYGGYSTGGCSLSGGQWCTTNSGNGTWWRQTGAGFPSGSMSGPNVPQVSLCDGTVSVGPGAPEQWAGMQWGWTDYYINWNEVSNSMGWVYDGPGPNGVKDTDSNAQPPGTDDQYHWGVTGTTTTPRSSWSGSTSTSYTCIRPARYSYITYTCPYDVTWKFYGPYNNPNGNIVISDADLPGYETGTRRGVTGPIQDNGTDLTIWGNTLGSQSIDSNGRPVTGGSVGDLRLCHTNWSVPWFRDEWGRYRINSSATLYTCVVKEFDDVNPATGSYDPSVVITPCGPSGTTPGSDQFWQQSCRNGLEADGTGGWINRGYTFSSLDCPVGQITCPVGAAATDPTVTYPDGSVVGPRNNFRVLADGQYNTITWNVLKPTGNVRNFHDGRTYFKVNDESQPWRGRDPGETTGGVEPRDESQFFNSDPVLNKWLRNADGTDRILPSINVQFYRATFKDPADDTLMPWSAQAWWRWEAETRTGTTPSSITMDFVSGGATATYFPGWTEQTVECRTDDSPANLFAMRSRVTVTP